MSIVNDQLFTPLLAYVSILNTLHVVRARRTARPATSCAAARRSRTTATVAFEDLFTGDQPSIGAAAYVVGADQLPAAQRVRGRRDRRARPRDRRQRAVDAARRSSASGSTATRPKPGATVDAQGAAAHLSRRGDHARRCRCRFRRTRAAASRSWWPTARRLSQMGSARAAGAAAADARPAADDSRAEPARARTTASTCASSRRDGGAVVKGESLSSLPPSVLAVMESDRNGGSFKPLERRAAGRVGNHDRSCGQRLAHADALAG